GAVAHSSAMLFYLDNHQSQADSLHPTLAQVNAGGRGGRGVLPAAGRGRGRGQVAPPITQLPPQLANLPPEVRKQLNQASPEERQRMIQQLMRNLAPQGALAQRQRRGLNENYAREL